jgi:hypothetical protein
VRRQSQSQSNITKRTYHKQHTHDKKKGRKCENLKSMTRQKEQISNLTTWVNQPVNVTKRKREVIKLRDSEN